ncbi:hypothetical protein CBR_g39308 [Chara braunii]|uniref:Peptidase S8/S53 domain-containing protein n=1 Tax=Chara braunii TaxID=69332 RepID=A0A388K136_CHABU|nr:hypothetical protein CBR_g39308 [Chara braunii]|eukprot:GBG63764.1 hypothetical protein CBR_g39308 [Chara braunii]
MTEHGIRGQVLQPTEGEMCLGSSGGGRRLGERVENGYNGGGPGRWHGEKKRWKGGENYHTMCECVNGGSIQRRSACSWSIGWTRFGMYLLLIAILSVSIPAVFGQQAGPEEPLIGSTVEQHIPATEWSLILGTRWTRWAPFTGLTREGLGLIQTKVDDLFSASSNAMEVQLNGRSTTFLARYLESMTDIAYYAVSEVTGGSPILTPVAGCCGQYGHFFIYTTMDVANALKSHQTKAFVAVDALPAFAKIEPGLLGRALDQYTPWSSGDGYGNLLPEPLSIKVVLSPGASSTIAEAEVYALDMLKDIPAKTFSFRALSAEVLLVGPVPKRILPAVVSHISRRPEVLRILPLLPYLPHNRWAKAVIQNPAPFNLTPLYDLYNITGYNQTIALSDTGIDTSHCFFADSDRGRPTAVRDDLQRKIVMYNSVADEYDTSDGPQTGHGTFIAGTIAGAPLPANGGASNERALTVTFSGVAKDSKLVFYDIGDASDALSGLEKKTLKGLLLDSIDNGARIHVVPFGIQNKSLSTQMYDLDARDVDDVSFRNEEFLVVVSVGNEGENGLYTLTSPAVSKNALAVGASLNTDDSLKLCASYCAPVFCQCPDNFTVGAMDPMYLSHFSSKGPTLDGRIKPDVVAPGMHMWSAHSSNGTDSCRLTSSQGTSTAAAVVGGVAALVRQYFQEGRYLTGAPVARDAFEPSGALVKACIIHGARGLFGYIDSQRGNSFRKFPPTISFPNQLEGWGLVRIDRVLLSPLPAIKTPPNHQGPQAMFMKSGRVDGAVILPGEVHSYSFVLRRGAPLRATLVWMDPPAILGALTPVLHDLDLAVIGPSGKTTYPNGLSAPDRLNNVERIIITDPIVDGTYNVTISAITVFPLNADPKSGSGQPYALVVTGDFYRPAQTPIVSKTTRLPRPDAICFLSSRVELNTSDACPRLAGDNFNDTSLPIYELISPPFSGPLNDTLASMEIGGYALFGDVQVQSDNAAATRTIMLQEEVTTQLMSEGKTVGAPPVRNSATRWWKSSGSRISSLSASFMMSAFGLWIASSMIQEL